jgi:hypothetical protein
MTLLIKRAPNTEFDPLDERAMKIVAGKAASPRG